tara:strand:- start:131 stop:634 length:504 start_codon:yes stop_codon:yes gene_type:complete
MEMCLINMLQQLITEGISENYKETHEDFYNLNSKHYKKVKTDENQEEIYEQEDSSDTPMTYKEYLKCYRLKDNPEMKKYLKDSYEKYLKKVKNNEEIKPCVSTKDEVEIDEQDDGAEAGTSSAGEGAGTASMGSWESGASRGAANPTGVGKWADTYSITRGKGNPVW